MKQQKMLSSVQMNGQHIFSRHEFAAEQKEIFSLLALPGGHSYPAASYPVLRRTRARPSPYRLPGSPLQPKRGYHPWSDDLDLMWLPSRLRTGQENDVSAI